MAFNILLVLHLRRLRRHTSDLTVAHWLALAAIAILPVYSLARWLAQPDWSLVAAAVIALVLWQWHTRRRDGALLAHITDDPRRLYRREYLLAVAPAVLFWLWTRQWAAAALVVLLSLAVVHWPSGSTWRLRPRLFWARLVPNTFFEWKAGLRRYGWLLVALWSGAVAAAPFLPVLTLLLLWLFIATVSTFYQEGEPFAVLDSHALPARTFLRRKLGRHLRFGAWLTAPVLVLYTAFHPAHWWVVLLFFVLNLAQHACFITEKYALYRPAQRQPGSVMQALATLGVVVPFLAPLPVVLWWRNYRAALRNLKYYLDAGN
jgi:hypothetical protein